MHHHQSDMTAEEVKECKIRVIPESLLYKWLLFLPVHSWNRILQGYLPQDNWKHKKIIPFVHWNQLKPGEL